MNGKLFPLTFALIASASALGCSSESAPPSGQAPVAPPDEIVAIPFPSTVELANDDLKSLQPEAASSDGTLTFTSAPRALDRVEVGSIIVGGVSAGSPNGLLRAVLAVERSGDRLTLKTGQAPIQLAYKKLHARFARSAAVAGDAVAAGEVKPQSIGGGSFDATVPFDYVLFDGDGDKTTTNDRIATDGHLGGGFDYEMNLDVDWGGVDALPDVVANCIESFAKVLVGEKPSCSIDDLLPEAKVTFVVDPKINANANVHGAAVLEYEKEVDLASKTLTPVILGPLVMVPVVDLTAKLEGGASASFNTGIHGSAVFQTSVTVSSKQSGNAQFNKPVLKSSDFGANETSVSLRADARVGVGARLNVLLFGVTGPYATARAYGAIAADVLATPCWKLHAGIEADLGIKVTSPALPFIGRATLVDWKAPTVNPLDIEIVSGSCTAAAEGPTLPPGSGPDGRHYASPTFTPWSRTFSSPVEGAHAASPGNATIFSDLQRTIDGHYVRSGFGVLSMTKVDESGGLVWSRDLDFGGSRLAPRRMRPTVDGAMLVASTSVTAPVVLTKVAQDGTVIEARGYDLPIECNPELSALSPDGAGGHWVVGACVGGPKSWVLHERGRDSSFWLLDPGAIPDFRLKVAESIGPDVFLSGYIAEGGDALFAMRMTPEGKVVYSKRYDGCASAPDAIPSQAIVGSQGEVTIAGSGGAQHNGLLVRLKPDGNVGFASFPGFGFGAGSVFLLDSLVELPTTGYVAGASSVRFTGEAPSNVPSAGLVGFDSAGKVLWAKRYTFGAASQYLASGHVGVRATDDGGIFVSALVTDPVQPLGLGGQLWSFKPFAKDGAIPFAADTVSVDALAVMNLDCSLTPSDRNVAIQALPIAARSVTVASAPVALTTAKQTSN